MAQGQRGDGADMVCGDMLLAGQRRGSARGAQQGEFTAQAIGANGLAQCTAKREYVVRDADIGEFLAGLGDAGERCGLGLGIGLRKARGGAVEAVTALDDCWTGLPVWPGSELSSP